MVYQGGRAELKGAILGYCLEHFHEEELWLVDSLQIFDPYWLSRRGTARAREMLRSLHVARPFTIHQLRDKLFTLPKLCLSPHSTVIISAINCFNGEVKGPEREAMLQAMDGILRQLPCKLIVGKLEGVMQHGKDSHACEV